MATWRGWKKEAGPSGGLKTSVPLKIVQYETRHCARQGPPQAPAAEARIQQAIARAIFARAADAILGTPRPAAFHATGTVFVVRCPAAPTSRSMVRRSCQVGWPK